MVRLDYIAVVANTYVLLIATALIDLLKAGLRLAGFNSASVQYSLWGLLSGGGSSRYITVEYALSYATLDR